MPRNTTFNLYLVPPDAPVRAVEIHSFEGCCVTWIYLLPNVVFPLQTRKKIIVALLDDVGQLLLQRRAHSYALRLWT